MRGRVADHRQDGGAGHGEQDDRRGAQVVDLVHSGQRHLARSDGGPRPHRALADAKLDVRPGRVGVVAGARAAGGFAAAHSCGVFQNGKNRVVDARLKAKALGEWLRRYSTKRFGYTVCDGTQWELEFEYSNGHKPVRFDGDNSYPYNFDKLQMLFGIDVTEEDDEDE